MQVKKAVKEGQMKEENAKASRMRERERRDRKDEAIKEAAVKAESVLNGVVAGGESELNEGDDLVDETEVVFPPTDKGALKHDRDGEDDDAPTAKRRRL
jgi:hypothetical protein